MPIYKAPLEDLGFLLNDVFQIDRYDNLPGFSDASSDVREAILAEAAKLAGATRFQAYASLTSVRFYAGVGLQFIRNFDITMGGDVKLPAALMEGAI